MTRTRSLLVATALAAVLATVASTGVLAADAARQPIRDVTVLFGRAVTKIRNTHKPTFARAVVLEADGLTRGSKCNPIGCGGGRAVSSAAGIVGWRFVFDNQPSRTRFRSATLFYGPSPKRFGPVKGYVSAFVEDVIIRKAPRMTLSRAVTLLRRAGYRKPFFNVTLRNPLGPKPMTHPLYIFGFANGYVDVDTVTGRVHLQ
jgi:hypothetical protein